VVGTFSGDHGPPHQPHLDSPGHEGAGRAVPYPGLLLAADLPIAHGKEKVYGSMRP
jgi:hypothetical protein